MTFDRPNLLIGSSNPNKILRWSAALPDLNVFGPEALGVQLDVPEGRISLLENARTKALAYARETGFLTLAEDAGLRIHALGGIPGLALRRWGFEVEQYLSDKDLVAHVVAALEGVEDTSATFAVAVALATPQGPMWTDSVESLGYFDLRRLQDDLPVGNPLSALFVSWETGRPWTEMLRVEDRPSPNRAFIARVRQAIEEVLSTHP